MPETERRLFKCQENILKDKHNVEFAEMMYKNLYPYIHSIILKHFSSYIKDHGDLDYYTRNTVHNFMEYYYNPNKDVLITRSFAGFLRQKILDTVGGVEEKGKPIKNRKTGDVSWPESLNHMFEDGNQVEFKDTKYSNFSNDLNESMNTVNLYNYISELVFTMKEYCSYEDYYLMLIALNLYLEKGEKYVNLFFKHYKRKGKNTFNITLDVMKEELLRKIQENGDDF